MDKSIALMTKVVLQSMLALIEQESDVKLDTVKIQFDGRDDQFKLTDLVAVIIRDVEEIIDSDDEDDD